MINNIFTPDEGEITINNEKAGTKHQNNIGYLPEERGLYKKTKVIDQLQYFGQLKGLSRIDAVKTARYWLDRLGSGDWANKKIQELSKGMSQKVQFVGTILHDPDILILDEPFSGFDPINTENLKKIILEMRDKGKTIILSTHVMHQVEQMCDDMCLINKGKVILEGEVRTVKKSFGRDTLLIEYEGSIDFLNDLPIEIKDKTSHRVELKIKDKDLMPNDIIQAAIGNAQIYKFELSEPSIHDIFIDTVKRTDLEENENE
jgi:ABC-2 type transport system ATP-binding protein